MTAAGGRRDAAEPIIDVDRLVGQLRARVAERRAAGAYTEDLGAIPLDVTPRPPAVSVDLALANVSAPRLLRPFTVGTRRLLLRLLFVVLDDVARQTDAGLRALENAVRAAENHARSAEQTAEAVRHWARDALAAEAGERERLRRIVESGSGGGARAARPLDEAVPGSDEPAASALFDYAAFEERFRPEDTVRDRQQQYVDVLRGRHRVVDLGCGRGELLTLLRNAGVSAYGVELDATVAAAARGSGLEIVEDDAVGHVEALERGAVDAIVSLHLVEHLPASAVLRLINAAAARLRPGGILILETPNPESLVAGSVNFHRDPTHVRPIHPDTLAFLCESAGFATTELRRLARVPAADRLPRPAPTDGELAGYVDRVVERLDELLYGFQDYAVVASR